MGYFRVCLFLRMAETLLRTIFRDCFFREHYEGELSLHPRTRTRVYAEVYAHPRELKNAMILAAIIMLLKHRAI